MEFLSSFCDRVGYNWMEIATLISFTVVGSIVLVIYVVAEIRFKRKVGRWF